MPVKFVQLPVAAVIVAGVLAAAAAPRPPGPAVITGHGPGVTLDRVADPLPPGLSSVPAPDYSSTTQSIWAGWADVAHADVQVRFVTANFVVPTVSCPGAGYDASFWVGLDGDQEGSTVEQVGVDAYCNVQTPFGWLPSYTSWWEMYHSHPGTSGAPHPVGTVSPGDQIAVSVYYNDSTGQYNLALSDGSRTGPDINTYQFCAAGWTCHNKTAEVIAEVSGGGPANGVYLAHFSPVNFTSIGVTSRDGTHGTLEGNNLWASNELIMAYQGHAMATPWPGKAGIPRSPSPGRAAADRLRRALHPRPGSPARENVRASAMMASAPGQHERTSPRLRCALRAT